MRNSWQNCQLPSSRGVGTQITHQPLQSVTFTALFHWYISLWRLLWSPVVTLPLQVQVASFMLWARTRGKRHLLPLYCVVVPLPWASVLLHILAGTQVPTSLLLLLFTLLYSSIWISIVREAAYFAVFPQVSVFFLNEVHFLPLNTFCCSFEFSTCFNCILKSSYIYFFDICWNPKSFCS